MPASESIDNTGVQGIGEDTGATPVLAGNIACSTSEGFGLTLMEAAGSGLLIIGFDVRYGNPNFIDDGKNG